MWQRNLFTDTHQHFSYIASCDQLEQISFARRTSIPVHSAWNGICCVERVTATGNLFKRILSPDYLHTWYVFTHAPHWWVQRTFRDFRFIPDLFCKLINPFPSNFHQFTKHAGSLSEVSSIHVIKRIKSLTERLVSICRKVSKSWTMEKWKQSSNNCWGHKLWLQ